MHLCLILYISSINFKSPFDIETNKAKNWGRKCPSVYARKLKKLKSMWNKHEISYKVKIGYKRKERLTINMNWQDDIYFFPYSL